MPQMSTKMSKVRLSAQLCYFKSKMANKLNSMTLEYVEPSHTDTYGMNLALRGLNRNILSISAHS